MRKVHETIQLYADVEPEKVAAAMPLIARLLVGKPLDEREYWSEDKRTEQQWDWVPVLPRTIGPGSTVRVKLDAYGGNDPRSGHNGKIGVVAAIRRDVVVNYTGETGVGWHHEMNQLERQMPLRPR